MHELSIASSIVRSVLEFAEKEQVGKILTVRLAVGELTCVEEEQLQFCYKAVTSETPIEDSALDIQKVEALVRCPHCSYQGRPTYWEDALFSTPIATMQCPECGKAVEATQGHECNIRSIEYVA